MEETFCEHQALEPLKAFDFQKYNSIIFLFHHESLKLNC